MASPALHKARAQERKARQTYDAALEAGTGTEAAREALETAAARVADLEAAEIAQAAPDPAEVQADEAEASAMVAAASAEIMSKILPLVELAAPAVAIDRQAARDLIRSARAAAAHAARVAAHNERMAGLRARLTSLEDARHQIVARRAEGHLDPKDGAELALLVADAEGLRDLIDRAQQDSPGPAPIAKLAAAEWSAMLREVQDGAVLAVIELLQDRLVAAVALVSDLPFSRRPTVRREIRKAVQTGAGKW